MNAERLHAKEVAEERLLRAIDRLEAAERRLEAARKASREAQEAEHLASVDWKNTQADWKRAESRFEEACTDYFTEASDRALQPVPGGSGGQLRSEEDPREQQAETVLSGQTRDRGDTGLRESGET